MFDQLFGSKTRVKLLSLFLNNPDRPYYVREITRKVDEQINSVRRELSNLLAIGIVRSDSTNNRLYYEVNKKYQFYAPLRAIFTNISLDEPQLKETREDDELAKKLRSSGNVELAFLTGTFVRDHKASTDIFIMGDVNRSRVNKVVQEVEKELNKEINFTIMTPEDFEYRLSLNDRFLTGILESKKIILVDETKADIRPVAARLKEDPVDIPVAEDTGSQKEESKE
ncbi:MAG TPA: winged helix-turn-helix domain-containing protein [Candidatus Dormibacteraeota bacterium]|nr:winged helix-turn-helix domain-containing protein [Candidatus Dormibacteraeota bacterium]